MYQLSVVSDNALNPLGYAPKRKTRIKMGPGSEDTPIPPCRRVSPTGDERSAVTSKPEARSWFRQARVALGLGASGTGPRRGLWRREEHQRESEAGTTRRKPDESQKGCPERYNRDAEMETMTSRGQSLRRNRSWERPGTVAATNSLPEGMPSEPSEVEKELGHVFISYSHQDADSMAQVLDYLVEHHIPTWTDRELTPGTSDWTLAIQTAVRQASLIVALCSPAAQGSKWVTRELLFGQDLNKPVLPILLSADATKSIPFSVYDVQRIDARSGNLQEHLPKILDHVQVLMIQQSKVAAPASKSSLSRAEVDQNNFSPSPSCHRCRQLPDHRQSQEVIGAEDRHQQPLMFTEATGRCGTTAIRDFLADEPEDATRIESQSDACMEKTELSSIGTRKWWLEESSDEENCRALNDGLDEDKALKKALKESQSMWSEWEEFFSLDEDKALERALTESQSSGSEQEEFFSLDEDKALERALTESQSSGSEREEFFSLDEDKALERALTESQSSGSEQEEFFSLDEDKALERALIESQSSGAVRVEFFSLDEDKALERVLTVSQSSGAVLEELVSMAANELQELALKKDTIKNALGSLREDSPLRPGRLTVQPEN